MTSPRHIAVIDIGKTNAKLALVDLETLTEIAVVTRPNKVQPGPPWPHFDTEGHWAFLLDGLASFHQAHRIDAISVTTHGASIVLLDKDGHLAAPILDYEHDGPSSLCAEYDAIRPPFSQTGSPRLEMGLNVGAQLHWQFATDPDLLDRTAHIVTYPQYWGHRLTKKFATDVTSLGCHTDLWNPHKATFSDLPKTLGIQDKIAEPMRPDTLLGTLLPQISTATGLPPHTPVFCGIHDSNASLYPHILAQDGHFSVVSTGTWVIAMTIGGTAPRLDPNRDTLMNVDALGNAVPSARFMGGREYETIIQGMPREPTPKNVENVLENGIMLLPSVETSTGPFQGMEATWIGMEPEIGSGERQAALSLYLAMMTETCLSLTGADGITIVEGPFARNALYLDMLQTVTKRPVFRSSSATGTSIGAALLAGKAENLTRPEPVAQETDKEKLADYAKRFKAKVSER